MQLFNNIIWAEIQNMTSSTDIVQHLTSLQPVLYSLGLANKTTSLGLANTAWLV